MVDKGVIVLADTRFSYPGTARTADDSKKIWQLGDLALFGFAGDVAIAEQAIIAAIMTVEHDGWVEPKSVARVLRARLRHRWNAVKRERVPHDTSVVAAVNGPGGSRFMRHTLYQMTKRDFFEIHEHSGLVVCGTGDAEFQSDYRKEFDHLVMHRARNAKAEKFLAFLSARAGWVGRLKESDGNHAWNDVKLFDKFMYQWGYRQSRA